MNRERKKDFFFFLLKFKKNKKYICGKQNNMKINKSNKNSNERITCQNKMIKESCTNQL